MKTTNSLYFSYAEGDHHMVVNAVSFTERANDQPDIHRVRIIDGLSDYFLSFNDPAEALYEAKKTAQVMMQRVLGIET